MAIDFSLLNYSFKTKPLVIGGKALEYHSIRTAGDDIDLVVTLEDITNLAALYPQNLKDLWGDFGVAVHDFEIWKTINCADYEFLSTNAIEEETYKVASLEQLLGIIAPLQHIPKYQTDLNSIAKRIVDDRYTKHFETVRNENEKTIATLENPEYLEKVEPTL